MKASVLLVVAGLALAAEAWVTAAAASVTAASGGLRSLAKMETNHFYLQGARITSCTQLSYSITSGQPYGGLSCSGDTITIMAGRDNSKGVATSFKSGLTGGNMFCSDGSCGSTPDQLNFYVTMDITMTVGGQELTLKSLRIGQGHYAFTNNWWIASPQCTSNGKTLQCTTTNADYYALFTQGSADKVSVSALPSSVQPGH
jgi:hypothetical protein